MAEAFIVRRGGGGGSGGTLVVTSSGAGTVTVSNTVLGKSYSKSVTAGGSVTFKGLKTGEWTITLSNGTQTTRRSVTINADYSVSVAYFSATISITYPATSTCVVTNSSGQTVASNTNTGSSTKTWTATVNATGTYTVTATATDGSGKSKSQTVSITTEGQSESATLSYELYLIKNGIANYPLNTMALTWKDTPGFGTNNPVFEQKAGYVLLKGKKEGYGAGYISGIDISGYTTLKIEFASRTSTDGFTSGDRNKLAVWTDVGSYLGDNMVASLLLNADAVTNGAMLDISSLSGTHLIGLTTVYTYERRIKTLMLK